MVNQNHILEAVKYLHERLEDITEKKTSDKVDVKNIVESQEMVDAIIVKNSDDIKAIVKTKQNFDTMIQRLETRIAKIDEEIETIRNGMKDKTDDKVKLPPAKLPIICNICENTFRTFSDLENHIKVAHENHRQFQCDMCKKTFVLKWRLEKHMNIHNNENCHPCHYFNNGKMCPFEELGCKFLHINSKCVGFVKYVTREYANSDIHRKNLIKQILPALK